MSNATSGRAFSYIRFSHHRQAEGGSLERQLRLTEDYCRRKGLTLDESLSLRDLGVSAFRGDNVKEGALAGFLEACRAGRVPRGSSLIIESLDRLSRDQIRPALQLFLALQDHGVTIVTHEPEREYRPDATDALALIEPLIIFARAHEESTMKSHRRKDGWRQARDRARAGGGPMLKTCPAWLEVADGRFREKPQAAATVRRIYALARSGLGVCRIIDTLVREQVPPLGTAGKWVKAYVYRILSNPAAMGTYQPRRQQGKKGAVPDGPPIPGYYPAVVSEAEWLEVQAGLQARGGDFDAAGKFRRGGKGVRGAGRKGKGEPNLFTGLVHCALTGEKMHLIHARGRKGKGERKHYVYLATTQETGAAMVNRIDYAVFEEAILSELSELDPADLAGDRKGDARKAEIARLSARVLDLDNRLERARQRARTAGDFDAYLDLIADLQEERKRVVVERAALEQEAGGDAADLGETKSLIQLLATTSETEREELRRRLRGRIAALVTGFWLVIVRRGKRALVGVQAHFRTGDRRRDYLLYHRPGNRYATGCWRWHSLADLVKAGDLNLRCRDDAAGLEAVLRELDLTKLERMITSGDD